MGKASIRFCFQECKYTPMKSISAKRSTMTQAKEVILGEAIQLFPVTPRIGRLFLRPQQSPFNFLLFLCSNISLLTFFKFYHLFQLLPYNSRHQLRLKPSLPRPRSASGRFSAWRFSISFLLRTKIFSIVLELEGSRLGVVGILCLQGELALSHS